MDGEWSALLGGFVLQKRAGRRITFAVIIASIMVLVVSLLLAWNARATLASLLFVQAGSILARICVPYFATVRLAAATDGIRITRRGAPLLFVSYREISAAVDDGNDACVVLVNGDLLRFGIDGNAGARCDAVRTMQEGWVRSHTRRGAPCASTR